MTTSFLMKHKNCFSMWSPNQFLVLYMILLITSISRLEGLWYAQADSRATVYNTSLHPKSQELHDTLTHPTPYLGIVMRIMRNPAWDDQPLGAHRYPHSEDLLSEFYPDFLGARRSCQLRPQPPMHSWFDAGNRPSPHFQT